MTLDGKIATADGDARWVTSEEARRFVHQLRGQLTGICVGAGTVGFPEALCATIRSCVLTSPSVKRMTTLLRFVWPARLMGSMSGCSCNFWSNLAARRMP